MAEVPVRARGRIGLLLACGAALLAMLGCRREDALVVYVSADEAIARPMLDAFTAETGIPVDPVFDTEATKTTGLVQRLRSERDRPRADVFWSSEIVQTIALAEEGVLAPVTSATLEAWPEAYRDASGRWYAFGARARVVAFAPARVSREDVPDTWMGLANDRWKGRVAMADPRFGTTRTHLGAIKATWDRRMIPGYFDAWIEGLAENGVRIIPSGNAGVIEAILAGQADLGMTDTDDVWAAQLLGRDIDLVYPRHVIESEEPGGGTLLIPNTAAVVTGSTDPERARRLVEFLISPVAEGMLLASPSRNIPLGPALSAQAAAVQPPDPLAVDWPRAAAAAGGAVEQAMPILTGGSSGEAKR